MLQTLEEWEVVGKVVHYFGHADVAVIKLDKGLKKGDKIRIVGGVDTDFEQEVKSMEVDHKKIEKAKKGDEIGLKVTERVRNGYKVLMAK